MYSNAIVRMLIAVLLVAPSLVVALTAKGFVRSVGTTSFIGAFTLDNGSRRDFTGQFDEPVGQFVFMNAQLKYTDLGQLTGQHFYSGIIRTKGISFKITNGPVITAHIDQSITASPVFGQVLWAPL